MRHLIRVVCKSMVNKLTSQRIPPNSSPSIQLNSPPPPLMPLYKPSKSKDLYHMAGRLGPRVVCRSIVVQLGKKLEGDNQGSILVSGNKHNFFLAFVLLSVVPVFVL